ncbi:hypothetical protein [Desulfarculus baarsii]
MNKKFASILLALLAFTLLALAACGGGGGGGGSSPTETPTLEPTPTPETAFSKADLAGYWRYDAGRFVGTMSFDSAGNPIYVTVDNCSYTTRTVTAYIQSDAYNLRIRAYGFCGDSKQLLKFALTTQPGKTSAVGILDRHYNGDGGQYSRYSCTMVKQ